MIKQSIGSLQKKYSIGSFELLSKTAPIQALSLLTVGPFVDYCLTSKSLLKYNYTFGAFVSCNSDLTLPNLARIYFAFAFKVEPRTKKSNRYLSLMNIAVFHITLMLPSCVLQHQSISMHRAILGRIIPGFRSYEDSMRADVGVAAV